MLDRRKGDAYRAPGQMRTRQHALSIVAHLHPNAVPAHPETRPLIPDQRLSPPERRRLHLDQSVDRRPRPLAVYHRSMAESGVNLTAGQQLESECPSACLRHVERCPHCSQSPPVPSVFGAKLSTPAATRSPELWCCFSTPHHTWRVAP